MRKLIVAAALTLGMLSLPTTAHAAGTWRVTIKSNATQILAGKKLVFTGVVHPKGGAVGQKVVLQEKFKPGKPWADQRKARIGAGGRYTISDRPGTNNVHSYRVIMPATSKHSKGISPTLTVKVYGWDFLVTHTAVNQQSMDFGSVDINGTTYKHSVTAQYAYAASVEFNLDHKCIKMRSTFGISDNSTTGGQAEVDLESDGTNVYTHTFDLGQHQTQTIPLASPLKIKLLAHTTSTGDAFGYGTFGTAQVLCVH